MRLSEAKVKNAKPQAKVYKLADGGGLFLQVMPTGGKLWRWKYRIDGKEKLMALGAYPDVSLAEVRFLVVKARRMLLSGIDPMVERKMQKVALALAAKNSFKSVAMTWYEYWAAGRDAVHAKAELRRIKADIFPTLGCLPITQIKTSLIVALVQKIEERAGSEIATRAMENIRRVSIYAMIPWHDGAMPSPRRNASATRESACVAIMMLV
jgi:hypothetical protein